MQVETQIVHTIVALRESEIDVSSTEFHVLPVQTTVPILFVVNVQDRRIIDGVTFVSLQHAALLKHLISTRKNGYVIEQHLVLAIVGENQSACIGQEKCLQFTVETLWLKYQDMF